MFSNFDHYEQLPIFLQLEVLVHVDIYTFMDLFKVNKKFYTIVSGKSIEGHGILSHYLYEARSKKYFKESILSFREDNMTWKNFYNRIINFYLRKDRERKIPSTLAYHYIYILLASYMNEGKLMECKILLHEDKQILQKYDFSYILSDVANHDQITILDYFYDNFGLLPRNNAYILCLKKGYLNIVEWLDKHAVIFQYNDDKLNDICSTTTISCLYWLLKRGVKISHNFIIHVAVTGNYEIFVWFVKRGTIITDEIVQLVMEFGHIKILDYLFKVKKDLVISNAVRGLENAIHEGNQATLNTIKWCYENLTLFPKIADVQNAASLGQETILKYLHSVGYKFQSNIINYTITSYKNNYDIILWLYSVGYKIDKDCLSLAKKYSYDNLISWLRTKDVRLYVDEDENIFD